MKTNVPILDCRYVLEPFDNLIRVCNSNVLMGLRLAERAEAFPAPIPEELQLLQMGGVSIDLTESKATFIRWILLNGLRDIHQSVGMALQRFIIFKTVEAELKLDVNADTAARELELRSGLSRLHFPKLVEKANSLCAEPLILQKEVESFNAARNCLEHAMGKVVKRFCNTPQKDRLLIFGRRFKLFFKDGEKEVPAQLGIPGPENAALMLGAEDFEIPFALDESIALSLPQFVNILNTCVFIRADLEGKLGVITTT